MARAEFVKGAKGPMVGSVGAGEEAVEEMKCGRVGRGIE
jgi:hypothetical protein